MTSLSLPHHTPLPKNLASATGLKCSPYGVLDHGNEILSFYLVPEFHKAGGNLSCTLLWLHLQHLQTLGKKIPPTLYLQMDNCWRDNKNTTVLRFLGYLVHLGIFEQIFLSCLPPGHTHEDIDQKFSVISKRIHQTNLLTNEINRLKLHSKK